MKLDHNGSWIDINEILTVSPIIKSLQQAAFSEEFSIKFKGADPTNGITVRPKTDKVYPGDTSSHYVDDLKATHRELIIKLERR